MIIKSDYRLSEPEPRSDVVTTLIGRGKKFPNKNALVDSVTGKALTYADLEKIVKKIGQALYEDYGLRKGDVILMISPNRLEYLPFLFGAMSIGVIVSTANPLYTVSEAVYHLEDCDVQYVVTSPVMLPIVREACAKYGKIKGIFVFGDEPGCIPYSRLVQNDGSRRPLVSFNVREDVAVLPCSSGTTGRPKGVMLTHYNLLYNTMQLSHADIGIFEEPGNERALMLLPLYHMFGVVVALASMYQGNSLIVMPKYDLHTFVRDIKHYKPTNIPVVPPVLLQLVKSEEVSTEDLASLKTVLYGAAPVSQELEIEWDQKFPKQRRTQGYGLTEVVAGIAISPLKGHLPYGSVGRLLPNMEARIVDPDTGKDRGIGEDGEVWVRGGNIMKGYYRKPDRTRDTLDADGWLHTGDIGHVDKDGFFYIVDRLKELIKYKGSQVAPAELEGVLLGHPSVADVAVVGVPAQAMGELPRAYIVLKPGRRASEKDIHDFMKEHTAPYKWLRGGVRFVDVIPKSPSGKILRRLIRDQIRQETKAKL